MPRYRSFQEFWPFYLSQHLSQGNRALHYSGSVAVLGFLIAIAFTGNWLALPFCLLVGYGPAWVGHFFLEKNRPATFKYPVYSLLGDFKMFALALQGRLGPELKRAQSPLSSSH